MGMVEEHQVKKLLTSYALAMRPERKARLRAVIELSCELEKIRAKSIFGTANHEQIIEAIIEGDWAEVEKINGWLREPHSLPEHRDEYLTLWETYHAMVMAHVAEAKKRLTGQTTEPD